MAAFLIILWKKVFSTEPIPTEIQAWVEQNCNPLDAEHQAVLAKCIAAIKKKIDSLENPNVGEVVNKSLPQNLLCNGCKKAQTYVLQYFGVNHIPNEIDVWIRQNYTDLDGDHKALVARLIAQTKEKIASIENPNVRALVNFSIKDCSCKVCKNVNNYVLQFFESVPVSAERVIRAFFRKKDITEEVLVQVVHRVHEIEKLPAYTQDPQALIFKLRSQSIRQSDPLQAKALSFLSAKHKVVGK